MIKGVAWEALAVFLGMVCACLVVLIGEMIDFAIYPPPPGLDPNNSAAMGSLITKMPLAALVIVVVGWLFGAFTGGWVAARVAAKRKLVCGMVFGSLFLLVTLVSLRMFTHPIWMWVAGLGEVLPATYLGARLATPRKPPASPAI